MGSMMKCKTCGKEISKKAKQCPECGHDYSKKESGGTSLFTLLVAGGLIVWFVTSFSSPDSSTYSASPSYTPAKPKQHLPKKTSEELKQQDINILKATITDLNDFSKFNNYKKLTLDQLKSRVATMRFMGKTIFALEDRAKKDTELLNLWNKAKNTQISVQTKHYPKMRDTLGPLLRQKMWEHDINVKTIGKGYKTISLTGGLFAANRNIKETRESLGVLLSDYRFKRIEFRWYKDAREYQYYDLNNKKDNVL